jgi:hypothetical protein
VPVIGQLLSVWSLTPHVDRRFVPAFTQINDMPKQPVRCHLDVADLDDHFGPNPMDTREHEW